MRVTIEDGVYNLLEVEVESMFDNGKGRMIRTTDIFLVRVGMRGNLLGARRRASKSGSRGGGSREWREEVGKTIE